MSYHPRRLRFGEMLSLAVVLCSMTVLVSGNPEGRPLSKSVSTPFLISPARTGYFRMGEAFLNPKSKMLVVFYWEDGTSRQRVLSCRFDSLGNPVGSPHVIMELQAKSMSRMAVAYNATDDRYFLAGADRNSDCIRGQLVDGNGRSLHSNRAGGEGDWVEIKPATKRLSAQDLKVGWIEASNRYMAVWTYYDRGYFSNPKNGHYLTLLDGSLKATLKTKQVRHQVMRRKSYSIRTLIALEDRILWGSAEDAADYRTGSRPVVWFTDFKGTLLKSYAPATGGLIYPCGTVPDECSLFASHNPKDGLFLLHWNVIGSIALSEAKSAETQYRIMDERGRFKSSLKIAPKTQFYQYRSISGYLASENRFFLACLEYKSYDKASYYFWGGKLLGFYVNNTGGIEDKGGHPSASPVSLLGYVMDPSCHVNLETLVPGVPDATLFAGYSIFQKNRRQQTLWGLLLE